MTFKTLAVGFISLPMKFLNFLFVVTVYFSTKNKLTYHKLTNNNSVFCICKIVVSSFLDVKRRKIIRIHRNGQSSLVISFLENCSDERGTATRPVVRHHDVELVADPHQLGHPRLHHVPRILNHIQFCLQSY